MEKVKKEKKKRIRRLIKETLRFHSAADYREILTRGIDGNSNSAKFTYPWLYLRVLIASLALFTAIFVCYRFSLNDIIISPIVTLGGITAGLPFFIFLYEMYPKRDMSLFKVLGYIFLGGISSIVIANILFYSFPTESLLELAVQAGFFEEFSKGIIAIIIIALTKEKNPLKCFLIGAAVAAGFTIFENMGYVLNASGFTTSYPELDKTVSTIIVRGVSSPFCHIIWTGILCWFMGLQGKKKLLLVPAYLFVAILHTAWDCCMSGGVFLVFGPLLWIAVMIICTICNINIVKRGRKAISQENLNIVTVGTTSVNKNRKKASIWLGATLFVTSVLLIFLTNYDYGMPSTKMNFESVNDFAVYVQDGHKIKANTERAYDDSKKAVDIKKTFDAEDNLAYVVQQETEGDYTYTYGYDVSADGKYTLDKSSLTVQIPNDSNEYTVLKYEFATDKTEYMFNISKHEIVSYEWNDNIGVSCVIKGNEFSNYAEFYGAIGFISAIFIFGMCMSLFYIKKSKIK